VSDRATTKELMARLQRHYIKPGPMPGGVFVPECGINGGPQTRADALYVGFTSTSGRILVGHELKASRADWRKELDTAGKADFWADTCHAWYIVAPNLDVVPKEEVPHGWGLMIPNARTTTRMNVVVKAQVHADRQPSWPAFRSILARLDTLRAQAIADGRQKAYEDERRKAEEQRRREAERSVRLTPEQSRRLHLLDQVEKHLGAPIIDWMREDEPEAVDPEVAAAALRLSRSAASMVDQDRWSARRLEEGADRLLKGLAAYQDALEGLSELSGRRGSR
jgi:hypothetical protein